MTFVVLFKKIMKVYIKQARCIFFGGIKVYLIQMNKNVAITTKCKF